MVGSNTEAAGSIIETTDGGLIFVGGTNSFDQEVKEIHGDTSAFFIATDVWIVRLSSLGEILWQKCLGGSNSESGSSIIHSDGGGYIIAGTSNSNDGDVSGNHKNNDIWIVKIDSFANIIWQKSYGGSKNEQVSSLIQTSDSGYAFIGSTFSNDGDVSGKHTNNDSTDVWVAKLSPVGELQWQKCLGGTLVDDGFGITQTFDGGFLLDARTLSSDGDVSGRHGNFDVWVVKLSESNAVEQNVFLKEKGVYPNPAFSVAYLNLYEAPIKQVRFFNLLGIECFPSYHLEDNTLVIETYNLPTGSYTVSITYSIENKMAVEEEKFIHFR